MLQSRGPRPGPDTGHDELHLRVPRSQWGLSREDGPPYVEDTWGCLE